MSMPELEKLLSESGAELIRSRKHQVWRLPNGAKLIVSKTPSCPFAEKKAIGDLKRQLSKRASGI